MNSFHVVCTLECTRCNKDGIDSCDENNCNCKADKNIDGGACDRCTSGFYPFPTCTEHCDCFEQGRTTVFLQVTLIKLYLPKLIT